MTRREWDDLGEDAIQKALEKFGEQ